MTPHVFAGNPLDRGDVQRRQPQWLAEQAANPQSRLLPLWQLNVLLRTTAETHLGWLSPAEIEPLAIDVPPIFLGLLEGVAHFAIDISQLGDPQHELNLDDAWRFVESRAAATRISAPEAGILAQSPGQLASASPLLQRLRPANRAGSRRSRAPLYRMQGRAFSPHRSGCHHVGD
jgi:NAD+ diphosphatase